MRKSSEIIKIIEAEHLGGFVLKFIFSNGVTQSVDFEAFLRNSQHPHIQKYLDQKYFRNFRLLNGELMWGDFDLIFPIMDLYRNSISRDAAAARG
jgi:hypothetical protein